VSSGTQPPRGFDAGAFLRLAAPMIISRAGLTTMGIADGIMVSRFQSHEFAWLSLAEGTLGRLLDVFAAFLMGGLVLVPRHYARGDQQGARAIWLRTIPAGIGLGVIGVLLGQLGAPLLRLMGQQPELAQGGGAAMAIFGWGHPAGLLAVSAAVYLEGINRPQFVATSVIAANVLNVALNWLFIGGHLGFAAMGSRGSALSTTLVRCGLCFALVLYAWRQRATPTGSENAIDGAASKRDQWRLSLGAGATVVTMVALSVPLTLFAGWLGVLPLAAFSAALSLAGPAALIEMGMADAAGIYVSGEIGRSSERSALPMVWASLRLTLLPVAAIVAAMLIWARPGAELYTKDPAMQAQMIAVIPLVAAGLLVDCVGFVMVASLRAFREVAWPTSIEIFSMLLLLPLGFGLAFSGGYGIRGLFLAMLISGVLRSLLLAWRFWWRTHSPVTDTSAGLKEAPEC
jgi:MATE family multidrug resistance protein